jgi:hypothetical protein
MNITKAVALSLLFLVAYILLARVVSAEELGSKIYEKGRWQVFYQEQEKIHFAKGGSGKGTLYVFCKDKCVLMVDAGRACSKAVTYGMAASVKLAIGEENFKSEAICEDENGLFSFASNDQDFFESMLKGTVVLLTFKNGSELFTELFSLEGFLETMRFMDDRINGQLNKVNI